MRRKILALSVAMLGAGGAYAADPGVTDTEIRIGDVNIMTGPASFIGRAVSLGSRIAAAEINANGGVNGRNIVVITEDDGYVPSRSFQALTKLLEVDEIFALNGTSGSANILAMMPLIEENNLPTVVTTAPNELVYDPVRPSVFTIGASYEDAFYGMMRHIHLNDEPENAVYGLIRQEDDFGGAVEAGYERAVQEFGLNDAMRLRYTRGTTNFSAEVTQLRAAGVNVLANGAIIAGAANVLSEARRLDMDLRVGSVWSENMSASVNLSAPAGYDYIVADYVAITGPAVDEFLEMASQYVSAEELAAFNRYTVVTYIGLTVLADAMARCGDELTRACTIEQLAQTRDFDTNGLSGPLSFDNESQLSGTAVAISQLDTATQEFTLLTDFTDY